MGPILGAQVATMFYDVFLFQGSESIVNRRYASFMELLKPLLNTLKGADHLKSDQRTWRRVRFSTILIDKLYC